MQSRKYWPIWVILILFFASLGAYIFLNQKIALWAYPASQNRNGELLKDFLSLSGGLAVIAGLYLAFIRSRAIEKTVVNQQEQIKNQQVEINLTRDSNLNEQFKNAVEHLGSEKEPIILGGVAELNQLATNQPEKFAQVVVKIYSSYCKSEAHYKRNSEDIRWSIINAIIENLCHNSTFNRFQLDLSYTNLSSVSLFHSKIDGWNFSYCRLPEKIHNVHFLGCNFNFSSGVLTEYVDLIFEDCKLNKVYLEHGKWLYPQLTGNTKLCVLALNSEFHGMQVRGELLSSFFINCKLVHTTFQKGSLSSTDFLCCSMEKVSFRQSEITSTKFDGSEMDKVTFRGPVSASSFRGVTRTKKKSLDLSLYSRLNWSLNKASDLSGVTFHDSSSNIDVNLLTEYDAYHISKHYNSVVEKYSYTQNFKIKIPEDWKEAALENGTYEE